MRLLLVSPSRFNPGTWGPTANGHLFALFSYLRATCPDVEVDVLDLEHDLGRPATSDEVTIFIRQARSALRSASFDAVAISCWTSLHFTASVAVAKECRALAPESTIIVGGNHPTAAPADFLYDGTPFDVIVTGNGEEALRELVLETTRRPGTPSVVHGRAAQADAPLLWDEFKYFRAAHSVPIWFSRGCPFGCSFCVDRRTGWRASPPRDAVAEIERACEQLPTVEAFSILDPLFAMRRDWRREFLQGLKAVRKDLGFWAETRGDVFDPADVALLTPFRFRIDIGLDAVSPPLIALMNKAANPERYLRAFGDLDDALNRYSLPHSVYLLLNYPGETTQMLNDTVDWAHAYYRRSVEHWGVLSAASYKYFPGTQLADTLGINGRALGVHIRHPEWWKMAGDVPLHDLAEQLVSHREKSQAGTATAHHDAIAIINGLSRLHTSAAAQAADEAPPSMLPNSRLFEARAVHISPAVYQDLRPDGTVTLTNLSTGAALTCSAAVSRWLQEGMRRTPPDRRAVAALFNDQFLRVETSLTLDTPVSPTSSTGTIVTGLGLMPFRLHGADAPRASETFTRVVQAGLYNNTRVWRSTPGVAAWIGLRGYAVELQSFGAISDMSRVPLRRGSLLMRRTDPLVFAIARSSFPTTDDYVVFGQIEDACMDLADSLVAGDIITDIQVDTAARPDSPQMAADELPIVNHA